MDSKKYNYFKSGSLFIKAIELTKSILQESKNTAVDIIKRRYSAAINDSASKAVSDLDSIGFCVIPSFLSKSECEEIISWIDEVTKRNEKIWRDKVDSDNRIFFSNTANKNIQSFYLNEFITQTLSSYEKTNRFNGFTLANKVLFKENNAGSGGGWHRDYVKRKQTKAILYLNNVDSQTGPFQYLNGSHQFSNILNFQKNFGFKYNQYRYTDNEIENVIKQSPEILEEFTGEAGTLLLVDTRGIHRGKPIESGVRYALTNYYWFNSGIPSHIKKLNPFT